MIVQGEDPTITNPPMPTPKGAQARLTSSMAGAVPVQQHTPDQQWFRDNAEGRMADPAIGAHAPVNAMCHRGNGTVDTIRMEANGDSYIDLGGKGARDFAAGRP